MWEIRIVLQDLIVPRELTRQLNISVLQAHIAIPLYYLQLLNVRLVTQESTVILLVTSTSLDHAAQVSSVVAALRLKCLTHLRPFK